MTVHKQRTVYRRWRERGRISTCLSSGLFGTYVGDCSAPANNMQMSLQRCRRMDAGHSQRHGRRAAWLDSADLSPSSLFAFDWRVSSFWRAAQLVSGVISSNSSTG